MITKIFNNHQKIDAMFFLSAFLFHSISIWITLICLIFLTIRYRTLIVSACSNLSSLILLSSFLFLGFTALHTGYMTPLNISWYIISSFLFFLLGGSIIRCFHNQQLLLLLLIIVFSIALPHLILTLYDIFIYGIVNPDRNLSFLDEETQRAVTGRTVELSLALSGISFLFLSKKDLIVAKITRYFIILSILALLCILHYVSRTGIVIFIVSIIIGLFYQHNFSLKTFAILLLTIVAFYLFQRTSIYQVFQDREIYESNFSNVGGRVQLWKINFALLLANPLGYSLKGFAHNFWLDIGKVGGLFSFIFLVIFSIGVLIKSIQMQSRSYIATYLRFGLLLFSIISILTLFTEPVHSGSPSMMYLYFLLSGTIVNIQKV